MIEFNLRQRLLILSLLPSALLAIILVAYFVFSGMRALEGELRERGMAVVRYLAPVSEYGVIAGHLESLQSLAQTTVQQPGVKAAVVVSRSGQLLAVSGRVSLSSPQLKRAPAEPGMIADAEQWIAFGAPVLRTLAESDALFDPARRHDHRSRAAADGNRRPRHRRHGHPARDPAGQGRARHGAGSVRHPG